MEPDRLDSNPSPAPYQLGDFWHTVESLMPQFLHLQNKDYNYTYLTRWL